MKEIPDDEFAATVARMAYSIGAFLDVLVHSLRICNGSVDT